MRIDCRVAAPGASSKQQNAPLKNITTTTNGVFYDSQRHAAGPEGLKSPEQHGGLLALKVFYAYGGLRTKRQSTDFNSR
jgi:hypothetical protein